MNNYQRPSSINSDKSKIRKKPNPTVSGYHDSDSSLKSPNSTGSLTDMKRCTFVRDLHGYGFKITGNAPVRVKAVRTMGSAWDSGLRENDIILEVNGENVFDQQHSYVVDLIRTLTTVDLLVKSGDQIIASDITHIPIRNEQIPHHSTSHIPTKINQTPPNYHLKPNLKFGDKPNANSNRHISKSIPPRNKLNPISNVVLSHSQSNLSKDKSKSSSESIENLSSCSDCSIGTSSTESNLNSNNNSGNIKKTPIDITIHPKPQQKNKLPVSTKTNVLELDTSSNKPKNKRPNIQKYSSPPEKDFPIKSNSYNAPSNKTSNLFQNSKKASENPRNKTIPSDDVKSNNMLKIVRDNNEFNEYRTLPKQLASNKQHIFQKSDSISNNTLILGREFDNNDKDDDESDNSLSIYDLLSSAKDAISRPGLVAILLQYVNQLENDLNVLMLYYACLFYKSFETKKEFQTDAPRLANEIITTFILEKSPLYVSVESEIVDDILKKLKSAENINSIFNPLLELLVHYLKIIIENVRGKITRGILMKGELPSFGNVENRDLEMGALYRTICSIINKNYKDPEPTDYILAKQIGLATLFQYFCKPTSLYSSSMRSRSTDGLNTLGNQTKQLTIADIFKVNVFCAAYQQKIFSSIRKKPKSISGHSLIEAVCVQPEECLVCENLLWGPSPQGLFCLMCQSYFHLICRKKIKNSCIRKLRKSTPTPGTKEVMEKPSSFLGRLSRKSSTSSVKNITSHQSIDNVGNAIFHNSSLIPDDKTRKSRFLYRRRNTVLVSISDQESINLDDNLFKAKSEDQLHKLANNPSINDVPLSNISFDKNSGGLFFNNSSNVLIQELIQDESLDDPDMKVDESFDAGAEIQIIFPNIELGPDKNRLIVLLEFYHKTRYILMNLKRFLYKLVLKWPQSQWIYFKALSLNCIQPFVSLIKSLVTTIESCIKDNGFVGLEKAVYDWLSEENDKRLKEWITLSSDLCCTNSLLVVKQLRQTTMRTIPELVNLLDIKMHKMVIVEELTQIRPLLISLPLIVKNIIKSFTKLEPKYTEELSIWKEVSIKMDYLCEYIDRCCIPLVIWSNNGLIAKRTDRNDWLFKMKENENINIEIINYCLDFPRTLFHFPIFDFQIAKIFSWSTNTKKIGPDSRINYLKKGSEVLLIFYKGLIVVLQKENDHYHLKPIKAFKTITDRLFPFIETSGFIATNGGQEEDFYILNIINNSEDASLVRVGFTRREFVDNWLELLGNNTLNLSRSISLYKLNDIKAIPQMNLLPESNNNSFVKIRSSQSFSNHTSNVNSYTTSRPETPNNDVVPVEQMVEPEPECVVKEIVPVPTELLDQMAKVCETLNDQKKDLAKFLNIPESFYENTLELIESQGHKSIQEIALLVQSQCGPMVGIVRQLILASVDKSNAIGRINKDDIKRTIAIISNLLKYLETMTDRNEVKEDNVTDNNITTVNVTPTNSAPSLLRTELISEQVKDILGDIIDQSINHLDQEASLSDLVHDPVASHVTAENNNQYKYVPEKCLISNSRDSNVDRSSLIITPTFSQICNPIDDVITTSRAQIILKGKSTNNSL